MKTEVGLRESRAIKVIKPVITLDPTIFELKKGPNGGNLYDSPSGTFEVYGAILAKYLELGAASSLLGLPLTSESPCPDGVGRYNHFQGGSIYWTPSTGAHLVYGAIRDRWSEMGWERSYLGYPISDEEGFDEGGRVSAFQGGQVYCWPDTGPIDLNDILVHYTGLVCFGETDWDQGTSADEPYALFGLVSGSGGMTASTKIYKGVNGGESHPDLVELYRGKPNGLVIQTTMMEHDEGDPNKYLEQVKSGVKYASDGLSTAVTYIPVVGPILGKVLGKGLEWAAPAIAEALNDAFDFGDDTLAHSTVTLSAKQEVVLAARTGNSDFKGIGYKAESPLMSGEGASYKVYFGLVTA